ncbi:MAG: prolipoprotein diacylglyceryl transferase, partial [Prevotella sp.]|nr:prolipoprotein diacylglyceryl transferase [Prevotella sp.]
MVSNFHPSSFILHPLYINWNPNEIAFSIGWFAFRWYSLCWLVGLLLAYIIVKKLYKEQKIK